MESALRYTEVDEAELLEAWETERGSGQRGDLLSPREDAR